jgi:D-psicose/D-tagatose/L-ribulose 3-epimerase
VFKYGVASLIWTEDFSKNGVPLIAKAKSLGFDVIDISMTNAEKFPVKAVRKAAKDAGIEVVTTIGMPRNCNLIDSDPSVRKNGVNKLKNLVDINLEINSKLLGGVIYAAWGYISGKPRTENEWRWSVEGMRQVGEYAKKTGNVVLAVEPVGRFESHFLNIADDAVRYCKEVGTGNVKVHLDSFHMIREESSFKQAVETCGKEYLAYVHVCENNRGIPGTGLVPWKEFFTALKKIDYDGALGIESFDPSFKEINRLAAIWRKYADTGEELAIQGLANLKKIEATIN